MWVPPSLLLLAILPSPARSLSAGGATGRPRHWCVPRAASPPAAVRAFGGSGDGCLAVAGSGGCGAPAGSVRGDGRGSLSLSSSSSSSSSPLSALPGSAGGAPSSLSDWWELLSSSRRDEGLKGRLEGLEAALLERDGSEDRGDLHRIVVGRERSEEPPPEGGIERGQTILLAAGGLTLASVALALCLHGFFGGWADAATNGSALRLLPSSLMFARLSDGLLLIGQFSSQSTLIQWVREKVVPVAWKTLRKMMIMEFWRQVWTRFFRATRWAWASLVRGGDGFGSLWKERVPFWIRRGFRQLFKKAVERRVQGTTAHWFDCLWLRVSEAVEDLRLGSTSGTMRVAAAAAAS